MGTSRWVSCWGHRAGSHSALGEAPNQVLPVTEMGLRASRTPWACMHVVLYLLSDTCVNWLAWASQGVGSPPFCWLLRGIRTLEGGVLAGPVQTGGWAPEWSRPDCDLPAPGTQTPPEAFPHIGLCRAIGHPGAGWGLGVGVRWALRTQLTPQNDLC